MTPRTAGKWTEEEARTEFRKFRFAANGGEPFCPHCDCVGVNTYRVRRLYRCKRCHKQFSDTSGTPFHRMRIGFADLMFLISQFASNKRGVSALSVAENMGRHYKTVLLWFHKIRQEIATRAEQVILEGEVEADGMNIGGHIRPKNVAKERKDHRRYPWRAGDRSLVIVAARERGGLTRTFIGKTESGPVLAVRKAIKRNSVVYTDKGPHWGPPFRGKFRLRQINHTNAYYTPDACTNAVESTFALFRKLEATYSHIAQNYLDLYAAEGAWRVTINRLQRGAGFGDIMRLMTRDGRSPLAGYFQGKKRSCPVYMADGSLSDWKPSFKGRRTARLQDAPEGQCQPKRRPLTRFWKEKMEFIDAEAFLTSPKRVPDEAGVYVILLRNGRQLVDGPASEVALTNLWSIEGQDHIYTGESYGIRSRILAHLIGDQKASNLRATLRALLHQSGQDDGEEALTQMLRKDALIGFLPCAYPRDVEKGIIGATASPLNIQRDGAGRYAAYLKECLSIWRQAQSDRS